MRVAFTGHRPEQLNMMRNELSKSGQALQDLIWREVRKQEKAGADTFLCGAARGADIICGEIVLAEKHTTDPQLKLICAIPFRGQADRWSPEWKLRYRELLRGADRIVQLCEQYQRDCFHIRNRYLVDNCDVLIAIYNGGDTGGTAYTVKYAKMQGKEIIILNPNTLTREVIPARIAEQ